MNIEIANRLLSFRRAHGYSQEELAERLGVSRQAVSKWERAEAAPDTDNLIALAALYGVLIDELINGDVQHPEDASLPLPRQEQPCAEASGCEEQADGTVKIEGRFSLELDDGPLFAATAVLCTIAYLVMGFYLERGWACGWIVFMLVPVIPTLVTAVVKRKPTEFLFPVLVTGLYLTAGMVFGRWHPEWIMFLTIPVYYTVAEWAERRQSNKHS